MMTQRPSIILFTIFTILDFSISPWPSFALEPVTQIDPIYCGKSSFSIETYERISYISLVSGFALFFFLTIFNGKKIRLLAGAFSAFAFASWCYVYFIVDYDEIRRNIFNFNIEAENALNNLAEAQDRYKSEQGIYLADLNKLHSHVAGASGLNRCVKILEIKVYTNYWTAVAQQVSSPNKIFWDSRKGSSLKKG